VDAGSKVKSIGKSTHPRLGIECLTQILDGITLSCSFASYCNMWRLGTGTAGCGCINAPIRWTPRITTSRPRDIARWRRRWRRGDISSIHTTARSGGCWQSSNWQDFNFLLLIENGVGCYYSAWCSIIVVMTVQDFVCMGWITYMSVS